ncbi:MAG: hypothetical protein BM556_16755 [Bacteriovorax sp. MedPE-SWde]|nr:MAG: hypothetical protein BM556_16755 [Bacteriovorax sp. MedPE-SWde]
MKRLVIFLCFVLSFLSTDVFGYVLRDYDRNPKSSHHLSRSLKKFKKEELIKILRGFVKETRPTRIIGSKGHFKSVDYVLNHISTKTNKEGELVVIDDFTPDIDQAIKMYNADLEDIKKSGLNQKSAEFKRLSNFTMTRNKHLEKLRKQRGRNIIWEKKGSVSPEEVIVIGAHYDTVAYDKKTLKVLPDVPQPGADNNASGVSISLALIEVLSELKLKKTVRVIFFDFQEFGFLGSWDYAKKLKEEKKKGLKVTSYVNLLMLGHDSKIQDKAKKYGNMKLYYSRPGSETHAVEKTVATKLASMGKKVGTRVKFMAEENSFSNGDNVSFVENGIPAITFTQNWEDDFNSKRIHTSRDFVETLNFDTLYGSFLFVSQAISSWALNIDK